MLLLIAALTLIATFLGGFFALRYRDHLHLILAYSAGAVLGVAFFDLLPESIELTSGRYSVTTVAGLIALGFIGYTILSHTVTVHLSADEAEHGKIKGRFGAASLSIHSLLDGLGIGLAFQVAPAVGLVIALGVIAHDFTDGLNTATVILKNGGSRAQALRWVAFDALAPTLGIVIGSQIHLSGSSLGLLLAVFTGFFIFIGASDLLPESRHHHSKVGSALLTILGLLTIYGAIKLAGS